MHSSVMIIKLLALFLLLALNAKAQEAEIIFHSKKNIGESVTMLLRLTEVGTVDVDWGNDVKVRYNVGVTSTQITAELQGYFVKVYGSGVSYFECNSAGIIDIDVSRAYDLQQIYCTDNELTALDVSCNLNLRRVGVANNNITDLDFSKNTLLTGLYLQNNKIGVCSMNKIYNDLPDRSKNTGTYNFRNTGNPNVESTRTEILKVKNWLPDVEGDNTACRQVILITNKNVGEIITLKLKLASAGNVGIESGGETQLFNVSTESTIIKYPINGNVINILTDSLSYIDCENIGLTDITINSIKLDSLNVRNNALTACALDSFYRKLPNLQTESLSVNLKVSGNPGSKTSTSSIAVSKNWKIDVLGDASGCVNVVKVLADKDLFVKRLFVNGAVVFTNRTFVFENVPDNFVGYEFLSNKASEKEEGVIIPASDGFIYGIAAVGALKDWTLLEGINLNYSDINKTRLAIYQKKVTIGETISIPQIDGFIGFTLLAEKINYLPADPEKDAFLSTIKVDDRLIVDFNKNKLNYTVYLPYSYVGLPDVDPVLNETGASFKVVSMTNIDGSESERTTTIVVTSQDHSNIQTYKICFEKLPELELFLCIGQSNMAGTAPLDPEKGDMEPVEGAYLFNSSYVFEKAANGMNRYSNILSTSAQYYGLTYSYAKTITQRVKKPIGLIVNARGGSAIQLWEKEGTDKGDTLYRKTLERAIEAKKWGDFKGVLWHQGEANRTNFQTIGYTTLLKSLVENLRMDLDNNSLFFVAGEIGHWNSENAAFNAMINTIDNFMPNSSSVSAEGLINVSNLEDNNDHFNREGLLLLGERYADTIINRIYTTTDFGHEALYSDLQILTQTNKLHIVLYADNVKSLCQIFNMRGQKVKHEILNSHNVFVLEDGIYIVCININDKYIYKKIIIKSQ